MLKAKSVCNDSAGIAENPNKMMINWAEKQAPEDRQATEDVLDAMTQYGVEAKRSLSSLRDEAEQRDNLELLQAVTMLRGDDLDEPRRPKELRRAEP